MATFNLAIYTPHGKAFSGAVESLEAPGRKGRFGVLANHASTITALKRGILRAVEGGRELYFVTGEGVLEVNGGSVTVLADSVSAAEDELKAKAMLAT
jgi:F-type H+-transporting ATPase subunit epsilon